MEKKIAFDLDTFKKGVIRVETRKGLIPEILKTDLKSKYPIVYALNNEDIYQVDVDGKFYEDKTESENDLFLIVEDKTVVVYQNVYPEGLGNQNHATFKSVIKVVSPKIINRIKLTIAEDGNVTVENLGL